MKKVFNVIIIFVLLSCNSTTGNPHPEYVIVSGKIINAKSKSISIYGIAGFKKEITFKEGGVFNDTIMSKIDSDRFNLMLMEDKLMTPIYFKNGDDVVINANAKDFKNTLIFGLDNADINNYSNKKHLVLASNIGFKKEWYRLEKSVFQQNTDKLKNKLCETLDFYVNIPEDKVKNEKAYIDSYIKRFTDKYDDEHNLSTRLSRGSVSPTFEDYENYNGTKTSLSDFKGKYVYIDVWATWCAPCKAQIPFLEELEKEYHNKNIAFVSMSVDKEKDYNNWRKMIEDKQMSGIQILAPNQTGSDFTLAYGINSIPRFILIDPEGKIVDFDAPRPSDKEGITALFSTVNI